MQAPGSPYSGPVTRQQHYEPGKTYNIPPPTKTKKPLSQSTLLVREVPGVTSKLIPPTVSMTIQTKHSTKNLRDCKLLAHHTATLLQGSSTMSQGNLQHPPPTKNQEVALTVHSAKVYYLAALRLAPHPRPHRFGKTYRYSPGDHWSTQAPPPRQGKLNPCLPVKADRLVATLPVSRDTRMLPLPRQ
ncbi:unnamed protein product [Danaus chrysippus]|uniref:(African queen) hypothetical protein n=1 Tax=Danaus chrysippus TaxID=151541 RepID=A0A8J2W569_9NEOP|nr:unnamed protein product [Danaus chrysippus]